MLLSGNAQYEKTDHFRDANDISRQQCNYQTKAEYDSLLNFLSENELCVSVITRIEVLGYHKLPESIKSTLEHFFSSSPTYEITEEVVDKAIELRQLRKIGLGDAILAATALVNELELATSNTKDFRWIDSISLIDPLKE